MDTVATFPSRRTEPPSDITTAPTSDSSRALAVTATYLLSEEGRKASLRAGGDGRAVQQLSIHAPPTRLHLVSVDAEGVARLKLRPRYQLDGEQRVVRIRAAEAQRTGRSSLGGVLNDGPRPPSDDDLVQIMMVAGARNQHYLQLWRPAA